MARPSLFAHLLGTANLRTVAKAKADGDYDDAEMENDVPADDDPAMDDDAHDEPDGDEMPVKGKKAKARAEAEEDDVADADDDDKPEGKAKARAAGVAAGRKAERARCRAIFAAPQAAGRPDLAAQLAFTTDMSAEAAIAVMATAGTLGPAATDGGLGDRMARVKLPNPGGDGGAPAGRPSLGARMIEVGRRMGRIVAD